MKKSVILTFMAIGMCALAGTVAPSVAHADNACGWDHAMLCEETDYLRSVAGDGIKGDSAALLKAGYASCVVSAPDDPAGPLDHDAGKAAVLATGVVTSPEDAEKIVSEARIDLC